MKETAKTQTSPSPSRRKKADDGRMTTAEISRLREQKRIHRHTVTALIGLGLMVGGTVMYFSPHANASDDLVVYEMDDSQIRDMPEFTDADFAFGTTGGLSEDLLMAESTNTVTPHPDFLSVSQDEATRRSEEASEADLPEDGTYDPNHLLVNMASDSTQDDAVAAISDAGCVVDTMISESDGRFGASFTVSVPDGEDALDIYKRFLANPKVYSCGFNVYLEPASVQTDDTFELDGASDFSDGNTEEAAVSLTQLEDYGVFDNPEETYGDLNSDSFEISPESTSRFILQQTEDDPKGDSTNRWEYRHLKYEDVWNVTRSNGRVTVAVIDTGVYANHRDLRDAIFNPIYVDKKGKIKTLTRDECTDPQGHGTHVAGIIGATANNRFGTAGISYNARIMPIQLETLDSNGKVSAASLVSAFNHISDTRKADKEKGPLNPAQMSNVRVVNVSLGQLADVSNANDLFKKYYAPAMAKLRDSGVLVVAAAGNNTEQAAVPYASFPSYRGDEPCDNLLSVINLEANSSDAVNGKPHRKSSSNYNLPGRRDCEISAPGSNILSTYNTKDNSFTRLTGTSQAAPIVSGTAALMFSANPDLTAAEVKRIIIETADGSIGPSDGFDEETGYGEINPLAAVQKAKSTSKVDDEMNIGKKNSTSLKNITIQINGQSFPTFSYDRIGYDLQYNDMRTSVPETSFKFGNIPTGLTLYRRISDPEMGEEKENAVNNVKYREVNQVITFLFAAAPPMDEWEKELKQTLGIDPNLKDEEIPADQKSALDTELNKKLGLWNTNGDNLYGIYAFYVRFNIVTGILSAEDTSGGDATGINDIVAKSEESNVLLDVIKGMELVSAKTRGVIVEFQPELPEKTQYLKVDDPDAVDAGIEVINLPDGWASTVTPDSEGKSDEITPTGESEPVEAYTRKYTVTVSNFLESHDYPVVLWAESISASTAGDGAVGPMSSAIISSDPSGSSSTGYDPDAELDSGSPQSTVPTNYDELKGTKCNINNKPYGDFKFDKTSYVIYFKVGSNLPPQPQLILPSGWSLSAAESNQLQKGPKYPYGGTLFTLVVKKNNLSRTYNFAYAFASDGSAPTSGSTQGSERTVRPQQQQAQQQVAQQQTAATQQAQKPAATSQPVADKPDDVVTTYVNPDEQQETTTVEIGGFNSQDTQEVNAGNAPVQWKPTDSAGTTTPSGNQATGTNTTNTPIANTSPLTNFVSGGTLTQTGDAVVIVTGAIISGSSLIGVALARRRMRNVA